MKTEINPTLVDHFVHELNNLIAEKFKKEGMDWAFDLHGNLIDSEKAYTKPGKRFLKINIGGSGAYMMEKETGELYNIRGYGQPDHNKKKKSDLGNIQTCDPRRVFELRHNYLR